MWFWQPIPTPDAPDGYRSLYPGRSEVAHSTYEIEVDQSGHRTVHKVHLTSHSIENIDEGVRVRARVRAVDDFGDKSEWSDWAVGESLHRYEWSWRATIGTQTQIPADGETPDIVIEPRFYHLCREYGLDVSVSRTFWSGSSGTGTPVALRDDRGKKVEGAVYPTFGFFKSLLKGGEEVLLSATHGHEQRRARVLFKRSIVEADWKEWRNWIALFAGVIFFFIPSCVNALDTRVGYEMWTWFMGMIR